GVFIFNGVQNNVIGGTAPGTGNVISGNASFGVFITDAGTSGNSIEGNDIGTDKNGTAALGNGAGGILIQGGATNSSIINDLIAYNSGRGVVVNGATTTQNGLVGDSITHNTGGGIYNHTGTMTVTNSTLSGNSTFNGGGIYNDGTMTVSNSTLSGNTAI